MSLRLSTPRRRSVWLALGLVAATSGDVGPRAQAQQSVPRPRIVESADNDWRFSLGDFASAAMPAFDDAKWGRVDLPHDWSADGPFSADFGSGNGYAPGGIGWYRKHFTLPAALKDKIGAIEFDGVYDHAEVWVNGHLAGGRPYGYSSFECPLTPFVKFDGTDNVVAVRVDHSRFADSRWYTGSGIYRHVRLRFTDPLRIAHWGTSVTTPIATASSATVTVETTIDNESAATHDLSLESEVVLRGTVVARSVSSGTIDGRGRQTLVQSIDVARPERWSTESPTMYVRAPAGSRERHRHRRSRDHVRDSIDPVRPERRVLPQRTAAQAQGRVPPSRCRQRRRGGAGGGLGAPPSNIEGAGRERHPHQPQSAGARVPRSLRPPGPARERRSVRRVHAGQEQMGERMERGRAEPVRLRGDVRSLVGDGRPGHGQARPQPSVDRDVEHRQRGGLPERPVLASGPRAKLSARRIPRPRISSRSRGR